MDQRKRKRAWAYCCIDTPKDEHERLSEQKAKLTNCAANIGFEIVGVSEDVASSVDFNRNGLAEATKAAAAGKMDVLLIVDIFCLGRDAAQTIDYIRRFHDWGVKVYSLKEGDITVEKGCEIFRDRIFRNERLRKKYSINIPMF